MKDERWEDILIRNEYQSRYRFSSGSDNVAFFDDENYFSRPKCLDDI